MTAELERLRAEVIELRPLKEKQEAPKAEPSAPSQAQGPSLSPEASAIIAELLNLSGQTCKTLSEEVPAAPESSAESSPDVSLKRLRELCVAAQSGAQRTSEERRRLESKLT